MESESESTDSGWRQAISWLFRRTVLVLILTVLLTGLYLRMVGLPRWATDKILTKASSGPYLVELGSVRWSLSRGVILKKVAIYRKGVVGNPAIQAGEIIIKVDLIELVQGHIAITDVTIRDSVVSPLMVSEAHAPVTPLPSPAGGAAPVPAPGLTASGLGNIMFSVRLIMERSEFLGIRINRFAADVDCQNHQLKLSNLSGEITGPNVTQPGKLIAGDACYDAQTHILSGELSAEADPNILGPLYQTLNMEGMHHFVQRFSIQKTRPSFTLQFEKLCRKDGPLTVTGRVGMQDVLYRDVPISRADATIDMLFSGTNSHLIVDPLYALRPEGHAQGRIAIDYKHPSIDFNGISRFDPKQLIHMLGLFSDSRLASVTFAGPVMMNASGRIDLLNSSLSDITVNGQGEKIQFMKLLVDKGAFDLHHYGRTNDFSNIVCSAYSGSLQANGAITMPTNEGGHATYSVTGAYESLDMLDLVRLKKPSENDIKGKLSGEIYLEGLLGKGQSPSTLGYGKARIREGRVFMLPIFGGLSSMMTKLIPGLDFVIRQNDANLDFTVSNSRVFIRTMQIQGDVLSLECKKGSIGFDKTLDCYVTLELMKGNTLVSKILRTLTFPLTKLLEFRGTGTLQDPKWYPTNFSTDLLERIGLKDKS